MPGLILAERFLSSGLHTQSQELLSQEGSKWAGNLKVEFTPGNFKERQGLLLREMDFNALSSATAGEQRNK